MKHFLNAAEIILQRFAIPLNITDIVDRALEEGILKSKGKTPENTMRARLSEHIRDLGKNSTFLRVGTNKFALREWNVTEYSAPPFIKKHKNESVVCLKQESIDMAGRFQGFSTSFKQYLKLFQNTENVVVCKRHDANNDYTVKQLVSYVIIKNLNGEILSYTRGNYTNIQDRLLKGVLCVGFGGHVNSEDYYDFFGLQDGGALNAALREVNEELSNIKIEGPKLIGVINDDSTPLGLNHFAFVYTTRMKEQINLNDISPELSINKTKFLAIKDLVNRYPELEFWSQLMLKNVFLKNRKVDNVLIKEKRKKITFPIIIVGEIGSGKTEIAKLISKKINGKFVSSRSIVSALMQFKDFGTSNRNAFQSASLEFIQKKDGCSAIANRIIELHNANPNIVIDGIRNMDTFEKIKNLIPSTILIYIDVPIDSSFDYFTKRSRRTPTIHEFREARSHEIEREVVLFKNRADIYIYNGSSFTNLLDKITHWLDEKI